MSIKYLVVLFILWKLYGRKFDFSGIPKDITSVKSHFTWFFCAVHVPSFDSSVNLSILKHFNNKNFSSGLIEIFLFSNCFTYIPGRSFRFNLNWLRFVFLPNKIELTASIKFGNKSNSLKRSGWITFSYRTNRTTIRLTAGSIEFD